MKSKSILRALGLFTAEEESLLRALASMPLPDHATDGEVDTYSQDFVSDKSGVVVLENA